MIAKVRNYIQQKRNAETLEQERNEFMQRFNQSLKKVQQTGERYSSLLEQIMEYESETAEKITMLAWEEHRLAIQEFEFLLHEARKSNIRAYWVDKVG